MWSAADNASQLAAMASTSEPEKENLLHGASAIVSDALRLQPLLARAEALGRGKTWHSSTGPSQFQDGEVSCQTLQACIPVDNNLLFHLHQWPALDKADLVSTAFCTTFAFTLVWLLCSCLDGSESNHQARGVGQQRAFEGAEKLVRSFTGAEH